MRVTLKGGDQSPLDSVASGAYTQADEGSVIQLPGQFPGGKYLDDLNPETFTDEEKQALIDLLDRDPYAFYNLWRDPDAAQRFIEGPDFTTTPANELYERIGALKLAGAPEHVVQWWQEMLEHRGRTTESIPGLPAKTKVIPEKMQQVINFCKHIDEELNYVRENRTDDLSDDFPEELPIAQKWQNVMSAAIGEPASVEIHSGTVRHYKATDPVLASSGTEIVEVTLTGDNIEVDMQSYAEDAFDDVIEDHINPYAVEVRRRDDRVIVLFKFDSIYE